MPGQIAVSAGGSAIYNIPISAPPGVGGIEPKLELAYDSRSGSGPLGMGWSLGGLSAIVRCPRTKSQDGVRGSVNYDDNDRYCLDGKRLMLVSGTYGQADAEYRTELDEFSKIVGYGRAGNGNSWFKVWTKGGRILEYGNTADSKIEAIKAAGTTPAWPLTTVKTWALNKISDANTNYLTVTYDEDTTNGVYRANRIDYTGNATAATAAQSSVRFSYVALTNPITRYWAGALTKQVSVLSEIATYSGASTLVGKTKLTYVNIGASQTPRISAVEACDAAANCLPALSLTYASQNDGLQGTSNGSGAMSALPWPNYSPYAGQQTDTTVEKNGLTWNVRTRGLLDVNGDGLPDFCEIVGAGMYVRLNNGKGFPSGEPMYWSLPGDMSYYANPVNYMEVSQSGQTYAGMRDLNGDGFVDFYQAVGNLLFIYWGTGSSFGSSPSTWYLPPGTQSVHLSSGGVVEYSMVDLNGDGLPDIYVTKQPTPYDLAPPAMAYLNTGSGFAGGVIWLLPPNAGFTQSISTTTNRQGSVFDVQTQGLLDMNGDGLPDFVQTSGYSTEMVVYLNTGSGFEMSYRSWAYPTNYIASTQMTYLNVSAGGRTLAGIGDLNGDGLVDLYQSVSGAGLSVNYGTGNGFSSTAGFWELPAGPAVWGSFYTDGSATLVNMVDMDGDGLPDYYVTTPGTMYSSGVNAVYLNQSRSLGLLVQVSSATGPTSSVSYGKLTDPLIYTADSGANAAVVPRIDLRGASTVVSSLSSDNGVGGSSVSTYSYGGMKSELGTGRGSLGFRWTKSKEVSTGIESYMEFRQDFPYTAIPIKSETRLAGAGNGGVLKRTTTTPGCQIPPTLAACTVAAGNRYFVYAASTLEENWDLNGTAFPTQSVALSYGGNPQYGSVTQSVTTSSDGSSKTTVNEYWPADTTNWILGRLKKATVTSVKP